MSIHLNENPGINCEQFKNCSVNETQDFQFNYSKPTTYYLLQKSSDLNFLLEEGIANLLIWCNLHLGELESYLELL